MQECADRLTMMETLTAERPTEPESLEISDLIDFLDDFDSFDTLDLYRPASAAFLSADGADAPVFRREAGTGRAPGSGRR